MSEDQIKRLLKEYRNAPDEFHATSYWSAYEKEILNIISTIDFNFMRSGKYPKLATFGFGDGVYNRRYSFWKKVLLKTFQIREHHISPYSLRPTDVQNMALHHTKSIGESTGAKPISNISVSTFGSPGGVFTSKGHQYTIQFLNYYLRYCFAHKYINFTGNETFVELGSGAGSQIEVLKKLYPDMTILCFDLPAQIYLCEKYLTEALGAENIVSTKKTLSWKNLASVEKGKVHFLGNWQIPLLCDFDFDVFWNAASFGEMEPNVVENYLDYIKDSAKWVYLLQMRHGQKTTGKAHVKQPVTLKMYQDLLSGHKLEEVQDAFSSISKLGGDYFEGLWGKM